MTTEDLRRMLSDLNIRWGDRFKIEKRIGKLKEEEDAWKRSHNPCRVINDLQPEATQTFDEEINAHFDEPEIVEKNET